MFLFAEVRTLTQMDCVEDTDKFYVFASKIRISTYLITGSGFLFSTLRFRGENLNFLNVLLAFISSIHNAVTSDGRNFSHIKMQVSVLVSVLTLAAIPIGMRYEFKGCLEIYRYFNMIVSIFSVTVVAVLFINLAVLLKRCFPRKNTCLCELIKCAGEESVGLYRQISTAKRPQSLIELTLRLLMSYIYIYIYIYIYDISSLMVNDLTLILLTWRKW